MCVVSNIGDYYRPRFPDLDKLAPFPHAGLPGPPLTDEQVKAIQKLIDAARVADKAMGDANCEDPDKTAWMADIEERVKRLEGSEGL